MKKDDVKAVENKKVEQIQKPLQLVVEDTKKAVEELFKQSQLPSFILTMMLENLLLQYKNVDKEVINQLKKMYEEQLVQINETK